MLPSVKDFLFRQPIALRWSDFDMLRHVNNAKYLSFAENQRGDYTIEVLDWDWEQDGCVVARAEVDYIKPVFHTDKVYCYTRCTRIGNKSFDLETIVTKEVEGKEPVICCYMKFVMVMLNYKTGQTYPIPQPIRERMMAYEKVKPIVE